MRTKIKRAYRSKPSHRCRRWYFAWPGRSKDTSVVDENGFGALCADAVALYRDNHVGFAVTIDVAKRHGKNYPVGVPPDQTGKYIHLSV